jgi:UTP--glucose-1-phosphate uridylyltransferase
MPVQANSMLGRTYDCGNKLGYLIANVVYGSIHREIGPSFKSWLKQQAS